MENLVIEKVNPAEFGLKDQEAQTIEAAFMPKIVECDGLKVLYEQIITQKYSLLCSEAKVLRSKLVKVRTGIAEILTKHKKRFSLLLGVLSTHGEEETLPVTQMDGKFNHHRRTLRKN